MLHTHIETEWEGGWKGVYPVRPSNWSLLPFTTPPLKTGRNGESWNSHDIVPASGLVTGGIRLTFEPKTSGLRDEPADSWPASESSGAGCEFCAGPWNHGVEGKCRARFLRSGLVRYPLGVLLSGGFGIAGPRLCCGPMLDGPWPFRTFWIAVGWRLSTVNAAPYHRPALGGDHVSAVHGTRCSSPQLRLSVRWLHRSSISFFVPMEVPRTKCR